jgi:ABC-2 type transport system permease protein
MPLLVAKGAVSWWEFAAAIAASLAGTIGVARLAANVYRRAVLRTGRRLGLRDLLASAR